MSIMGKILNMPVIKQCFTLPVYRSSYVAEFLKTDESRSPALRKVLVAIYTFINLTTLVPIFYFAIFDRQNALGGGLAFAWLMLWFVVVQVYALTLIKRNPARYDSFLAGRERLLSAR